ncbi:MAG: chloride channel protein [Acidimicrobiales bacterium]|nr:chloride channel protein [Actinomycetota bacterium]
MRPPAGSRSGRFPRPSAVVARAADLREVGGRARQAGLLAVATGAATGFAVAVFDRAVATGMFERLLTAPLWVQAVAPALGLAAAAVILRTLGRGASPSTADEYIKDFHDHEGHFDQRPVPARLLASAATLGSGAALGFEGPSIYIGASIGSWVQSRWSRFFSREDNKLLMVCGAAAGVAAIFKAPATGLVFALEVPYREDLARRMLLPAMFSAATSYTVYVAINGTTPLFPVAGSPPFDLRDLGGAAALGLLAGLGARGVARLLRWAKAQATSRPPLVRLPVVAVSVVATFVAMRGLTGESLTVGSGYETIAWALTPRHAVATIAAVFLLRLAATLLAVGGGGVGGLFVPLVVQGALLGALLEGIFHAPDPTFFPLLGVAAFLGAGYRVPLAAVVFVAETTGQPGFVVPALLAAATSQLVMGKASVTPYQEGTRTSLLTRRLALPVTAALRTDAATVPPDATVAEFFDHHVSQLRLRVVPVVAGDAFSGMVYLADIAHLRRTEWESTTVGSVARTGTPTAELRWSLGRTLQEMEEADVDRLPVLDDGRYIGLVTSGEILKLDHILDEAEAIAP